MTNNNEKILVIGPKFFEYSSSICEALRKLGFEVHFFDERLKNNFAQKVILRSNIPFVTKFIKAKINHKLRNACKSQNFDRILILNPEVLSPETIRYLDSSSNITIYFWDSFANKSSFSNLLEFRANIVTFDSLDSKKNGIKHIPLFYDDCYTYKDEGKDIDFAFIGTLHSDRQIVLSKILDQIHSSKNVFLFRYLPSRILYFVRKFMLKKYQYQSYSDYAYEAMTQSVVAQVLKRTKFVIDIAHPKQVGYTSRTLEALAAGCNLITTNEDIKNASFYDPRFITVINRNAPEISSDITLKYVKPRRDIISSLHIENWLKSVLELK